MPTLLYVYKDPTGKAVIKLDYMVEVKDKLTKKKQKRKVNLVSTGTLIKHKEAWLDLNNYELIWGSLD